MYRYLFTSRRRVAPQKTCIFYSVPGRWYVLSPTRKETSLDARDFNNIEMRAVNEFHYPPPEGKATKEIRAIRTEILACFLPGRAKDLSAHLYFDTWTLQHFTPHHTFEMIYFTVCQRLQRHCFQMEWYWFQHHPCLLYLLHFFNLLFYVVKRNIRDTWHISRNKICKKKHNIGRCKLLLNDMSTCII